LLKENEPSVVSTIKSSSHSPLKPRSSSNSSGEFSPSKTSVNLPVLISSNKLIDFVKNNTQSRQFQECLAGYSEAEIELVIGHIKESLVELIMHEYGNYMVQKLYAVCNDRQRLSILNIIAPKLNELARNKQGTHTIQSFLAHFSTHE
jgi:hypothetical protein